MKNGEIGPDSPAGIELGFTSDKFYGWLYKQGQVIYISFIASKQQGAGNLSALFKAIWERGYTIKIPTPTQAMIDICLEKGFVYKTEYERVIGERIPILERRPPISKGKLVAI